MCGNAKKKNHRDRNKSKISGKKEYSDRNKKEIREYQDISKKEISAKMK